MSLHRRFTITLQFEATEPTTLDQVNACRENIFRCLPTGVANWVAAPVDTPPENTTSVFGEPKVGKA